MNTANNERSEPTLGRYWRSEAALDCYLDQLVAAIDAGLPAAFAKDRFNPATFIAAVLRKLPPPCWRRRVRTIAAEMTAMAAMCEVFRLYPPEGSRGASPERKP